jgi:nitroreductase
MRSLISEKHAEPAHKALAKSRGLVRLPPMKTIDGSQVVEALNWRYATKQFDKTRKISPEQWTHLEEAVRLAPSSLGLQPWTFIVVETPAVREELKAASFGQPQITDASHLVVFAAKKDYTQADTDAYLARVGEVRGAPPEALAPFRSMVEGSLMSKEGDARAVWLARQVYIALGVLLTTAAVMGIDACPMEGISPPDYDRILGLEEKGLTALAVATVGYRSSEDKYAEMKKVRFPAEQVILHV